MYSGYFYAMDASGFGKFSSALKRNFPLSPTADQAYALELLARYCLTPGTQHIFLLKGYAGTGKTTLIKTLVHTLPAFKQKTALLAPTGRAAKVMTQYSQKAAFTIHKYIYRSKKTAAGTAFTLRENKAANTLYIVDEASMIANGGDRSFSSRSLLEDLLHFVQMGVNCKLLLVGDKAQLSPVGDSESPALDHKFLQTAYGLKVSECEMKEVMRQSGNSQILANATQLRLLQEQEPFVLPKIQTGAEVIRLVEGFEVEDALNHSFANAGREDTAILVRSNKRAALYNQQIRARILWQEEEIGAGDYFMVVKNNYYWLPEASKAGFIANGDIVELLQIYERNAFYGHRFARVKVRMVDYPQEAPFETIIMLDVIDKPAASLSWEESQAFYQEVLADYADIPQKNKRHLEVRANPYFNALQVKFAYAITCHKAQGGQWENVFVEKPWMPSGQPDLETLRWLYTAMTRARDKVYLIGFGEEYF